MAWQTGSVTGVPLTIFRRLASRHPSVLVCQTTDAIAPDDLRVVRFVPHIRAPNGRPLAEALVWASTAIVVDELMQHSLELAWPEDLHRRPGDELIRAASETNLSRLIELGGDAQPCVRSGTSTRGTAARWINNSDASSEACRSATADIRAIVETIDLPGCLGLCYCSWITLSPD